MKTVSVKILYGTDIRLVELPFSSKGDKRAISYPDFTTLIAGKYFPLKSAGSLEGHVFKYTDQEGELVTLGDSSDFDIWLAAVRAHVMSGQALKPVRLNMMKIKSGEVDRAPISEKLDSGVCDKKKFEKKVKKLKMLPSKVKADLVKELMVDDPWIQHIFDVQSWESDIQGNKGKGECKGKGIFGLGECRGKGIFGLGECKGKGIFGFKGGKGKGKGVKGKGLEVADQYPSSYGPDRRESWLSTDVEYPYTGDWYDHLNSGISHPEADRQPPSEGFFGRGYKNEEKGGGNKSLMARFVSDVTLPPGITVAPDAVLTKTWRVRNDSDKPWPGKVFVLCVGGDPMTGSEDSSESWCEYCGDTCKPGEEREVSVTLTSPSKSGTFEAFWRLCTKSPDGGFKKFGMRLRVNVTVDSNQGVDDDHGQDSSGPGPKLLAPRQLNTGESTEAEHVTSVQEQEVLSGGSDGAEFQLVEYD